MKLLKEILLILLIAVAVWVDLPQNKIFTTHLGLDLKGGSQLVFEADTSKIRSQDLEDALNSSRDIIERRVNFIGTSEPTIKTVKSGLKHRINVDLPGVKDIESAVNLIGKTAQLTFREEPPNIKISTTTPIFLQLIRETGLTGRDIKKATVVFSQQDGKPQVSLSFTDHGTKLFAEITQKNIGKPVGIFLDDILISTPVVQQAILEGNAVITGNFTTDEAKKLAISINSGALPLPIKLIQQKNIGPTLGALEVRKSVYAGVVGLGAVMLFMIIYYGRLGFIASAALIIYGIISLAIFKAIPITLTLPGVAGFILSVGMAVDTNILIFERIKEERRHEIPFDTAIRLGFRRAIYAIKDANLTTLLVAFILFNPLSWDFLPQFGLVRGFAVTLAIGIITSLFTGIVITKRLIKIFYKQ